MKTSFSVGKSSFVLLFILFFLLSCSKSNKLTGLVTDFEGNEYETIVIGNQEWMAENLRASYYSNGDEIPNVIDNHQWNNLTMGAWSFYDNDESYNFPYGKLYNWYAVNDNRNICPTGWRVPAVSQWNELYDYLGEDEAGGKMKVTGTQYWQSPNRGANNESGFSGYPAGQRLGLWYSDENLEGTFSDLKTDGLWWSSTSINTERAEIRILMHSHEFLIANRTSKKKGVSVRCIKR